MTAAMSLNFPGTGPPQSSAVPDVSVIADEQARRQPPTATDRGLGRDALGDRPYRQTPPDVDDDAATQSRPSLHDTNRLSSKERGAESDSVFAEVEGWAIVPIDTVRAGAQDARRRRRPTTKLTKSLANVTSRLAPPARTFRCGAPV